MVVIHSRLVLAPGLPDMAVVHLFRFKDNKITELWDVVQEILVGSPNANGMF